MLLQNIVKCEHLLYVHICTKFKPSLWWYLSANKKATALWYMGHQSLTYHVLNLTFSSNIFTATEGDS